MEPVELRRPPGTMWVDEEGKLKDKPVNARATEVTRKRARLFPGDVIVGPALVTKPGEVD